MASEAHLHVYNTLYFGLKSDLKELVNEFFPEYAQKAFSELYASENRLCLRCCKPRKLMYTYCRSHLKAVFDDPRPMNSAEVKKHNDDLVAWRKQNLLVLLAIEKKKSRRRSRDDEKENEPDAAPTKSRRRARSASPGEAD
ncbi:MAG: hypothetical protein Hyperionvirus2_135 [Hyperionvirus sp.]|uniref:Uncharacterized protein n=1 Tax=Hyperionvirus sp. TaxID=2487770 RepID=A0A3G5A6A7_9VIRU|nr:MAG: hypothetical protein Hyperionvirus2_135 [Hyperionvirus sp.]